METISWPNALILGFLQGATEFLPVSSSAHLVIFSKVLGLEDGCPLAFAVLVHLGTLLAVLAYYRRDLWAFGRAIFVRSAEVEGGEGEKAQARRLFWMLILGTVPAGLVGFFLADVIDVVFASPLAAACGLLVTATLLWRADRFRGDKGPDQLSWLDGLLVGVGQAVAIMPGISRSGTTVWAALGRGLSPRWAPRYSFLLSIPAIAGAGVLEGKELCETPLPAGQMPLYVVAALVAAVVGYLSILLVVDSVRRGSLFRRFGIYCLVLSALTIGATMLGYLS